MEAALALVLVLATEAAATTAQAAEGASEVALALAGALEAALARTAATATAAVLAGESQVDLATVRAAPRLEAAAVGLEARALTRVAPAAKGATTAAA